MSPFLPSSSCKWRSLTFQNLEFDNPLGIAGGVDKNGEAIFAWNKLGCGFIELGTITPKPQSPNPGKILDRNIGHKALWNKMGFPNKGMEAIYENIVQAKESHPNLPPLFINLGKNRDTENQNASDDYVKVMEKMKSVADAYVVNISSPNTKGLRDLFSPNAFSQFLKPVVDCNQGEKPLLLKLSPDLEDEHLHTVLDLSYDLGVDGWILTNTTTFRPQGLPFPTDSGGMSGAPLAHLSERMLENALKHLGDRRNNKLIISAGGILTPEDVKRRLDLGADLIQVYSALVFDGPFFFKRVSDKFKNIQ